MSVDFPIPGSPVTRMLDDSRLATAAIIFAVADLLFIVSPVASTLDRNVAAWQLTGILCVIQIVP